MQIAICGLAASGKSTIAKLLAVRHRLVYIGLGSLFRAAGTLTLKEKRPLSAIPEDELSRRIAYRWDADTATIILDGIEVESLQSSSVAEATARMLMEAENWNHLFYFCRSIVECHDNVICEGRNAGTEFLPSADIKCALVADLSVRVERRYAELCARGEPSSFAEVRHQITGRDWMDTNRSCAPFKIPRGALIVDTTQRTILDCVETLSVVVYQANKAV